jgi:hypothetical protein
MRAMGDSPDVGSSDESNAPVESSSLEELVACPMCGSGDLDRLPVRNLNSRDPVRAANLMELLDDDFFLHQAISICASCRHVFQSTRPTRAALGQLYERFTESLAKTRPSRATMVEYVLRTNVKDYVQSVANTLETLERIGLLEGARSALEVRTFGGGLLAMLKGRGVEHCEGAYLQEFDAEVARHMFGIDRLWPFSFARPIEDFETQLEHYDLIVLHEGLTHSHEPQRLLSWVSDHLSPRGAAVFFREPDTPAFRPYLPLDVVFNNFHLHLFNSATLSDLARDHTSRLSFELIAERHPSYRKPVYVDLVLRLGVSARPSAPEPPRPDLGFYQSWIRRDESRVLQGTLRLKRSAVYRLERTLRRLQG